MKKIILLLLPLAIILSLFSIFNNKDLTFVGLLNGLKNFKYYEIDIDKLMDIYSSISFEEFWSFNIDFSFWNDTSNFLDVLINLYKTFISSFSVLFDSMKAIYYTISGLGQMFYNLLLWLFEATYYLVSNLLSVIKFVFTYIFGVE